MEIELQNKLTSAILLKDLYNFTLEISDSIFNENIGFSSPNIYVSSYTLDKDDLANYLNMTNSSGT